MEKAIPHYAKLLVNARKEKKLTIKKISEDLKIKTIFLTAIEEGNLGLLPKDVYTKGFVRSYADYLKLDSDMITMLFAQYLNRDEYKAKLKKKEKIIKQKSKLRKLYVILACIIFAVTFATLIYLIVEKTLMVSKKQPLEVTKSNVTTITKEEVIIDEDEGSLGNTTLAKIIENSNLAYQNLPPQTIILSALEESWLEIKDSSSVVLATKVLAEGESYLVPNKPNLELAVGNASGVIIHFGKDKWFNLSKEKKVMRKISLNYEDITKLAFNLE